MVRELASVITSPSVMRGLVTAAMQTSLFASRSRSVRASLLPSVASLILSLTDILRTRCVMVSFFCCSAGVSARSGAGASSWTSSAEYSCMSASAESSAGFTAGSTP